MQYFHECPAKFQQCSAVGNYRFPFRVFISLSTAPKRLHGLYTVLPSVDLPCVFHIVLNVPDDFRGERYDEFELMKLQKAFPSLYVNHFGKDHGPISKLLPTIALANNSTDVIITIDDDTLYESENIIALCNQHMNNPDCIISNKAGPNIWNLKMRNVNGFTGVLYPVRLLTADVINTMLDYNQIKQCRIHDDMTISMALHKHRVPIQPLDYNLEPCQVSLGLDDPEALYRLGNHYLKHPACAWRIWGLLK
jgi:hypothetical protein